MADPKPQKQQQPKSLVQVSSTATIQPPPERPPLPPAVLAAQKLEEETVVIPQIPGPIDHRGDTRSKAFQESHRSLVITAAGEVLMKLVWGCNVGDMSRLIHAIRDNRIVDPARVLIEASKAGFGCPNCLTLLEPRTRRGALPIEPQGPDRLRLGFRDADDNPLLPGHRGPGQMVDVTQEKEHADRTRISLAAEMRKGILGN